MSAGTGLFQRRPADVATGEASLDTIPTELLEPNYQNRLRVIGRHLDVGGYRWINLMEVEGGLLARAFGRGSRQAELMEFPNDEFRPMMETALRTRGIGDHGIVASGIAPTGYEDILRAIGFQLDRRVAHTIAIVECRSMMFVTGMEHRETSAGSTYQQFDFVLSPEHVQTVLDAAFRRRAAGAATMTRGR
jgi:hypothetical protein